MSSQEVLSNWENIEEANMMSSLVVSSIENFSSSYMHLNAQCRLDTFSIIHKLRDETEKNIEFFNSQGIDNLFLKMRLAKIASISINPLSLNDEKLLYLKKENSLNIGMHETFFSNSTQEKNNSIINFLINIFVLTQNHDLKLKQKNSSNAIKYNLKYIFNEIHDNVNLNTYSLWEGKVNIFSLVLYIWESNPRGFSINIFSTLPSLFSQYLTTTNHKQTLFNNKQFKKSKTSYIPGALTC